MSQLVKVPTVQEAQVSDPTPHNLGTVTGTE